MSRGFRGGFRGALRGVFVGVGSNIDPEENIKRALALLSKEARIKGISTFYRTEPLGGADQPEFYNGVIEIEVSLPPRGLKTKLLRTIEKRLGRKRSPRDPFLPRTIDLDLLIYDDLVIKEPDLVLPDPDITERPFIALPLYELSPGLVIPGTDVSIRHVAEGFKSSGMEPLSVFTSLLRREFLD